MTPIDRKAFDLLWSRTARLYDKQPADDVLDLVFAALAHFDIADVRRALTAHVRDPDRGQYMPRPADIVRRIQPPADSAAAIDDDAGKAWDRVVQAVSAGKYRLDDAIIDAVLRRVGANRLTNMGDGTHGTENRSFVRRDFLAAYRAMAAAHPAEYLDRLPGSDIAISHALT